MRGRALVGDHLATACVSERGARELLGIQGPGGLAAHAPRLSQMMFRELWARGERAGVRISLASRDDFPSQLLGRALESGELSVVVAVLERLDPSAVDLGRQALSAPEHECAQMLAGAGARLRELAGSGGERSGEMLGLTLAWASDEEAAGILELMGVRGEALRPARAREVARARAQRERQGRAQRAADQQERLAAEIERTRESWRDYVLEGGGVGIPAGAGAGVLTAALGTHLSQTLAGTERAGVWSVAASLAGEWNHELGKLVEVARAAT